MKSVLTVYCHGEKIGTLKKTDGDAFVFQYDSDYLKTDRSFPLSLSLPLQEGPFGPDKTRPFFANLLPEGEVREAVAKIYKIARGNDFELLAKIGGECAGAVSVLPEGTIPGGKSGYIALASDELEKMASPGKRLPLLVLHGQLRLSLAGAQDKIPVFIEDANYFLPSGDAPSSHILKPENRYFEETVQNEAFCMWLAKAVGLDVPDVFILKAGANLAFVVERYDRRRNDDGSMSRIHQEDFCQAMELAPEKKYQSDGGPGLRECFELIRKNSSAPLIDRKKAFEWVVFNYLIGNADAHAKNISIFLEPGRIRLAPFYDLMSTCVYPELVDKMSMKIGGENRFRWVAKRHWQRFAAEIGFKSDFVLREASRIAETTLREAEGVADRIVSVHGGERIVSKIAETIRKNAASIRIMALPPTA